jgi:hypothetical protein
MIRSAGCYRDRLGRFHRKLRRNPINLAEGRVQTNTSRQVFVIDVGWDIIMPGSSISFYDVIGLDRQRLCGPLDQMKIL